MQKRDKAFTFVILLPVTLFMIALFIFLSLSSCRTSTNTIESNTQERKYLVGDTATTNDGEQVFVCSTYECIYKFSDTNEPNICYTLYEVESINPRKAWKLDVQDNRFVYVRNYPKIVFDHELRPKK